MEQSVNDDSSCSTSMLVESNRLKTFENWPNSDISPISLAKAGFYYLNRSDQVKCAWCKGVIAKWERQDNPWFEHQRFFPQCPRVKLGPLIEMTSEGIRELGIHQISPPKKPEFSSLDIRLRTYDNWPIPEIQKPDKLAEAGLYYQNVDDQVRCFHCNIGLRSWQKEDDPWFEHARWYPDCQFVHLAKGSTYVQQVTEVVKRSTKAASISTHVSIEEAMNSPPVLQALEIGIDVGSIRIATQNHLTSTGRAYDTIDDLLKAIFDENNETTDEITLLNNTSTMDRETCTRLTTQDVMPGRATDIQNLTENAQIQQTANLTSANSMGSSMSTSEALLKPNSSTSLSEIPSTSSTTTLDSKASCVKVSVNEKTHTSDSNGGGHLSLEEENQRLKDARLCKICLDQEVGVVFLPCGHLVTCVQCASGVNQCPMCRMAIKGFVRTYLS